MFENRPSFFRNTPPVVLNLVCINVVLWLVTMILSAHFGINVSDLLGMHYVLSDKFHAYQLLTYMFMHDTHSLGHLFFNMFGVYMFGCVLERVWGPKKFLFYYIVCGLGAAVVQQLFWSIDYWPLSQAFTESLQQGSTDALLAQEQALRRYFRFDNLAALPISEVLRMRTMLFDLPLTVGASGSLFGVLLAFGWLFPEERLIMLFFPIPIKARLFVVLYGVAELFLGVANFSGDNVAHFAHLGGMLFGLVVLLVWKRQGKLYNP